MSFNKILSLCPAVRFAELYGTVYHFDWALAPEPFIFISALAPTFMILHQIFFFIWISRGPVRPEFLPDRKHALKVETVPEMR